jgi:hypothetical protein
MNQNNVIYTTKPINVPKAFGISAEKFSKLPAEQKIKLMRLVYQMNNSD